MSIRKESTDAFRGGQKSDRRNKLLCGFAAGILCGIGDILLTYFGDNGTAFFSIANTDIANSPMLQFELSFLFGLIAAPLFYIGGNSACKYFSRKAGREHPKICRVFSVGIIIMVLSVAAAHSICCASMMCVKSVLEQGISPEMIEEMYYRPLMIPFIVTNIWVTVSEILVSAAYLHLFCKKKINVPRVFIIFNPICIYLIFTVMKLAAQGLTNDWLITKLFAGGASFGYGLMFLACYFSLGKDSKR